MSQKYREWRDYWINHLNHMIATKQMYYLPVNITQERDYRKLNVWMFFVLIFSLSFPPDGFSPYVIATVVIWFCCCVPSAGSRNLMNGKYFVEEHMAKIKKKKHITFFSKVYMKKGVYIKMLTVKMSTIKMLTFSKCQFIMSKYWLDM